MINKTKPQLKKALWKLFSEYIRRRDKGVCFTCGKIHECYTDRHGNLLPGWKKGQAGHFITAANCGIALYFHEQNVHCQCYQCNINLSGNWVEYERQIIMTYGLSTVKKLKQLKWLSKESWSKDDYLRKIDHYKSKLKDINL